jgi:hypothetical protein
MDELRQAAVDFLKADSLRDAAEKRLIIAIEGCGLPTVMIPDLRLVCSLIDYEDGDGTKYAIVKEAEVLTTQDPPAETETQ